MESPGRPKSPLPQAQHVLTGRVRRLIDDVHLGNVRQASRVAGLPYATVLDLYRGRTVNPGIGTLESLGRQYDLTPGFFSVEESAEEPRAGLVALLPPHPRQPEARREFRRVLIPYAAWPMYVVFRTALEALQRLPADPDRPIVGAANGETMTFRLATFLFQPLLAAEKLGVRHALLSLPASVHPHLEAGPAADRWVSKLNALGIVWRETLGTFLES